MKKKSTSRTASKLSWKNTIMLAIIALALCASPGSRADLQCHNDLFSSWSNPAAGDWFDSSNWCGGVPICFAITSISNGGTAQIGSGTNANACETFLGQYQGDPFTCENGRGSSGSLSVDGGTLHTCSPMHVGYQGKGNLKITNGGLVSTNFITDIAVGADSYGTVTVGGASSQLTVTEGPEALYVGGTNGSPGGTGLLTVTSGGKVTATSVYVYKSGTLSSNGAINATSGPPVDGTFAPNGGGGTLNFSGALQLSSAAVTQCQVTPHDPSTTPQVSVSGQASLGGRLSVTMTGDFSSAPSRFTLLYADSVDSVHNKFDSQSITYPTGQGCWVPQLTYDYSGGHVHVYLDRVYNCN